MNPNSFRIPELPTQRPPSANRPTGDASALILGPFSVTLSIPQALPPVLYSMDPQPRPSPSGGPQPLSPDNPHRLFVAAAAARRTGQERAPSPRHTPEQINSSTHPEIARANRKRAAPEPQAAPEPAPHIKRQRGAPVIIADSPAAGNGVRQEASAELLCETLFPPSPGNPLGLRNRHYLQRHTGLMETLGDVFRQDGLLPGQRAQALFQALCAHGLRPANSDHLANLLHEAEMIWTYLAGPGRQATERQKALFVVWLLSTSGDAGPQARAQGPVAQAQGERLRALGQQHCHGFQEGLSRLLQYCVDLLGRDLRLDRKQLLESLCTHGFPTVFARMIVNAWDQAASAVFRRQLRLEVQAVKLGDVVRCTGEILRRDLPQCFGGILCTVLDAPDTRARLDQGLGAFQNPESYTSFLEWVRQVLRQYCQELAAPHRIQ